ncbi:helix-turn-helix domain-containing protein [Oceanispirochaeta sp.]|jgi:two-component system response regulator YesN|uniref:response regulator n=1 Tax=Oceanispirochaeta sp. TaxID=2035350 RepID=UPI00262D481E|nr:helix-turn-helix domain-containing protein [Oceanispirochaeta sp.]MDA3957587.1 response regulator [Oceanispirochaeta sp.]
MINLLIVEDEPLVRASIQSFLDWENHGFSFIGAASDGEEGLLFLKDHPETDIVLLDIHMPVMDGISMLKRMRESDLMQVVLILSADNQFQFVRTAFQLGALDYILKSEMDEISLLKQLKGAAEQIAAAGRKSENLHPKEKRLIIDALLEDILHNRNKELNCHLIEDLDYTIHFPCRIGQFTLELDGKNERIKQIIRLRGQEFLKDRGASEIHFLSSGKALFFISPDQAQSFSEDFSEILKDAMNLSPDIRYSCICENREELPGQFTYLQSLDVGQSRMIRRAQSYIRKNYASPQLSLEEVSHYVEVSRTHLSAQFKKESGMTFRDYLTKTRIDSAKKLLEETNLRVYEICEIVGYPNVEHFSRIFKKVTGISPNRYHQ